MQIEWPARRASNGADKWPHQWAGSCSGRLMNTANGPSSGQLIIQTERELSIEQARCGADGGRSNLNQISPPQVTETSSSRPQAGITSARPGSAPVAGLSSGGIQFLGPGPRRISSHPLWGPSFGAHKHHEQGRPSIKQSQPVGSGFAYKPRDH